MAKSIISEGKTTNEAIEKGLKELKVSKNKVDIKVLENTEKRSFFSILTPRVVKVELTLKEEKQKDGKSIEKTKEKMNEIIEENKPKKREIAISDEAKAKAKENVEKFMKEFLINLPEGTEYEIQKIDMGLNVSITNAELGYLIGYRGETLYALQNILTAVAGKNINSKVRVILDIEGYKSKREKTLEDLAQKVARTVVKTGKSYTLEPMGAYERKIIHSKLQNHPKVETKSIGEEPRRRVVIKLKSKSEKE